MKPIRNYIMKRSSLLLVVLLGILLTIPIALAASTATDEDCNEWTETCSVDLEALALGDGAGAVGHDDESVCIIYFYSETCPHCKAIKPFLDEIEAKYGEKISIHRYDVALPESIELYNEFCQSNDYDGKKIPLLGISDKLYVGENQIRDNLENDIETALESDEVICPLDRMGCHEVEAAEDTDTLIPNMKDISFLAVLPIVLGTGIADGINPCAFAVLIFIMAFLQEISGNKKRLARITISYIAAVLLVNIALGIMYFYTSIKIGYPGIIRGIAIAMAVATGLINIKDFFVYGKGVTLRIPVKSKKFIEALVAKASVPSAIILGGAVAILEAPCSIPIYLTVLEVLKSGGHNLIKVMPYIILYNLMFILPLVVLASMVYVGTEVSFLEKWREQNKGYMKLVIGLLLLALAIAMLLGLF